jgi:hypothetical protein
VSRKYRAALVMAILALAFMVMHLWTGWEASVDEASSHGEKALWGEYLVTWVRDTVENLQSEFWQLAVQFALLAGLFTVIGVEAYEQDQEELRQQLARMQQKLDRLTEKA